MPKSLKCPITEHTLCTSWQQKRGNLANWNPTLLQAQDSGFGFTYLWLSTRHPVSLLQRSLYAPNLVLALQYEPTSLEIPSHYPFCPEIATSPSHKNKLMRRRVQIIQISKEGSGLEQREETLTPDGISMIEMPIQPTLDIMFTRCRAYLLRRQYIG